MEVTKKTANIFVLGDLVLDHAIFARPKLKPHQPIRSEGVYEVTNRFDTGGGAANCARVLAAFNTGHTFLWGIAGRSPWGTFPEILDSCRNYDGAESEIIFRGLHDETIRTNQITRIISVEDDAHHHVARFDDIGNVCVTTPVINTLAHYLDNAHAGHGLHSILINDLDMDTITEPLIKSVTEFANRREIPLFIDPKRELDKYKSVQATAILPNLKEWCHIIGEPGKDSEWRNRLKSADGLGRMAKISLMKLPNFTYHIIKCDKDGAVVIVPADNAENRHVAYLIPPHPLEVEDRVNPQLGYGDVLAAILVLEFCSRTHKCPTAFLNAFHSANAVVACYRQTTSWNRMPNRAVTERFDERLPNAERTSTFASGALFLPGSKAIRLLSSARTAFPKLMSSDRKFNDATQRLADFFLEGWQEPSLKSAILTARGGSGKTLIIDGLSALNSKHGIATVDFSRKAGRARTIDEVKDLIDRIRITGKHGDKPLLLVIDEAFKKAKNLLIAENGVLFLEVAHEACARLLLVDADFDRHREELSDSQFLSRCEVFELPAIETRPRDIVYILSYQVLCLLAGSGVTCVKITSSTAVSLIDWFLEKKKSARILGSLAKEMKDTLVARGIKSTEVELGIDLLPSAARRYYFQFGRPHERVFEFML